MKSTQTIKILAFTSFIGILVCTFILTGLVQQHGEAGTPAGFFLLLLIIVGLSLLNLFQIMRMTAKSIHADDYLKKSASAVDEAAYQIDDQQEEAHNEEDNHQLDPDVYEEKLIPQNDHGQNLTQFCETLLSRIAEEFDIVQGLFYVRKNNSDAFTIAGKFAYYGEQEPQDFQLGQALTGQTAKNQKVLRLNKIPENYVTILSGLGESSPNSLLFAPLVYEGKTVGLIELAAFKNFDRTTENLFNTLSERMGKQLSELL